MMTKAKLSVAAPSTKQQQEWNAINWRKPQKQVRRLQMRIAKAFREGDYRKVKALCWLLTHSRSAKLLSVKRVVTNRGARTPGVDNVVWEKAEQLMQAVTALGRRRGYLPQPLRRIYIPKKQKGKFRPLSIPTMPDRAQQALYLLALEPIAEMMADKNAYGFRPFRSTADAIQQCFIVLARRQSAHWVLEGDIRGCFDNISHCWLLNHVPMDKQMLGKWLAAGYLEEGLIHPTDRGTPQGGIISPCLLTVTLSGLERAVAEATELRDKVHVVVYADDFVITAASKEVLEEKVKPVVEGFLAERGLTLSEEKTRVTHISEGFDFLGFNLRKYNGKLITTPAKSNVKRHLDGIRETIKRNATIETESLIGMLNPRIHGWGQYFRHVCSKETYGSVDRQIFKSVWAWALRRHPEKGRRWIRDKYFRTIQGRHWAFFAVTKGKEGEPKLHLLEETTKTPIKRHIKIKADAMPYDPDYHEYLGKRMSKLGRNWWWRDLLEHAGDVTEGTGSRRAALREARAV